MHALSLAGVCDSQGHSSRIIVASWLRATQRRVTSFMAQLPASGRGTMDPAAGAARRIRGPFITVPSTV